MTTRINQRSSYDAFLVTDEELFLSKHYPDHSYEPPRGDEVVVPRDAYTVTIHEAARILGLTRNGAYKLIVERGGVEKFPSLRKVGPPTSPIYLLDVREVYQEAKLRG